MTARKVWLRLKYLPPDSEFKRQLNPHTAAAKPLQQVLADLIDVHGYIAAGSKWTPYEQAIADAGRRAAEQMSQDDRFAALEAQAERNRSRDVEGE